MKKIDNQKKQKKLSLLRLSIVILIFSSIVYGAVFSIQLWKVNRAIIKSDPWFASYVDVTATPTYQFQLLGNTSNKDAILSFIVSSPSDGCIPSWGGAYTMSQANTTLDLNTRIARLQQQGGSVAISFGGKNNSELAIGCLDENKLLLAYESVIDQYNIDTIDLDIEGSALTDINSQKRRADVLEKIQSEKRSEHKNLAVWLTLPVSPEGLTLDGANAVNELISNKVDIAGVNLLLMDYGSSLTSGTGMLAGSESALTQTHRQLGILYQKNGIYLTSNTLWSKIGGTPMIGQNDDSDEIFTLDDAQGLNKYALTEGIGRLSMWSANRDVACGSNYVDVKIVSDSCSGVSQSQGDFSSDIGNGFNGSISLSSGLITKSNMLSETSTAPDNPLTSPYQIWSDTGIYTQGTKVVWHHNIYQAKWWTQGDVPDNPVLQSFQTPWELVGPVLAGQTPIPQPTLPVGTYPNWSGKAVYNTGQRVLLNGVPYQAKWWNTGSSPEASYTDPNGSPWIKLTPSQIEAVLGKSS